MKTLVTGGSGFIGSAVVRRLLARNQEVRCYLEPNAKTSNLDGLEVERVTGDVLDRTRLAEAMKGCDTLYHLAAIYAIWMPDPQVIYRVNVEGSQNVLRAAGDAGMQKIVFTSSLSTLGTAPDGRLSNEETAFTEEDWHSANDYIRSKCLSEKDALRAAHEGMPVVVVNPGFPFGPRDIAPTPTGGFIVMALRRKVPVYVDSGFCAIDVDDVAEGHVLAAEKGRVGEKYLLGNHNVSFSEFYATIAEVASVPAPRWKIPAWTALALSWAEEQYADRISHRAPMATVKAARYAVRRHYCDNTKARTELGLPSTPLRVTIEKAVTWFREHGYAR